MIILPPRLNTEEGVVLQKEIKGLTLKEGGMDSGQPKPSNVHSEEPREDQATWSPGPDSLGLSLRLPFCHPGWTRAIVPVLGQQSAIPEAGFQCGGPWSL